MKYSKKYSVGRNSYSITTDTDSLESKITKTTNYNGMFTGVLKILIFALLFVCVFRFLALPENADRSDAIISTKALLSALSDAKTIDLQVIMKSLDPVDWGIKSEVLTKVLQVLMVPVQAISFLAVGLVQVFLYLFNFLRILFI